MQLQLYLIFSGCDLIKIMHRPSEFCRFEVIYVIAFRGLRRDVIETTTS